jgi:hypothetical protein
VPHRFAGARRFRRVGQLPQRADNEQKTERVAVFAEQLITSMLVSYRASSALLRAVRQFVRARANTPFYRKIAKLEMRTFQYLVELFLEHRKEIKHPDPQTAVSFALIMLTSTLIELILEDYELKTWQVLIPKDDQTLKRELLRSFLNYLAVEQKGSPHRN